MTQKFQPGGKVRWNLSKTDQSEGWAHGVYEVQEYSKWAARDVLLSPRRGLMDSNGRMYNSPYPIHENRIRLATAEEIKEMG